MYPPADERAIKAATKANVKINLGIVRTCCLFKLPNKTKLHETMRADYIPNVNASIMHVVFLASML